MRIAIFLLLSVGCYESAKLCTPGTWGYVTTNGVAYSIAPTGKTPGGIALDGDPALGPVVDRLTGEVEACLSMTIDRSSFTVKVPRDWSLSCDGQQQLLPSGAPSEGCDAKGLVGTCPCRWRALIQCPNAIVATPSLYLYKDALVRFVAITSNPWANPRLAKCAAPTTAPLSVGP